MLLETRTVSRKTPKDGKLEIDRATADVLRDLGAPLAVSVGAAVAPAAVASMACTCEKGGGAGEHVHYFLESDVLKALEPGRAVSLELQPDVRRVVVQ